MAKALEVLFNQEFISEYDDDDVKTSWELRSLTGMEFLKACTNGVDYEKMIELGLTGWNDFKDSSGNQIPFSVDEIRLIPTLILQDIALEIQKMSMLNEDERKN